MRLPIRSVVCRTGGKKGNKKELPRGTECEKNQQIPPGRVPFSLGLSPFAPELLFSRGGFGIPLPRRPVRLPFPGQIWCLLAGASLSFRFPRLCCLFALAVGADGWGRRLDKACTVNTIGELLLTDQVTPVASRWCRSALVDPRPRFASRFGSTPAGRQPGAAGWVRYYKENREL